MSVSASGAYCESMAKAIIAVVVAAVVVAGSFVRYEEPKMADRLVHRYGVAPPLIACGRRG